MPLGCFRCDAVPKAKLTNVTVHQPFFFLLLQKKQAEYDQLPKQKTTTVNG